jgi:hypothetical protein
MPLCSTVLRDRQTPNDHHQKISGDGSGVLAMIRHCPNGPSKPAFFPLSDRDQPVSLGMMVSAAGSEATGATRNCSYSVA